MNEVELVGALKSLDQPVDPTDLERDRIWRVLATELETNGLMGDRSQQETIGNGLWWIAAAAVVLVVGVFAVWPNGRDARVAEGGATSTSTEGSVTLPLPSSHPAARILEEGADDATEFADRARELGLPFQCGTGGLSQLCLLYDDGVMAVVPLVSVPGFTISITGEGVDREVMVPLDDAPFAVPGPGGQVQVIIRNRIGDEVLSMSGNLMPNRDEIEDAAR